MKLHEKTPGALYDAAIEQLSVCMGARGGANNPDTATQWVQYLQSVVQQQCTSQNLGKERYQELKTLAAGLTAAGRGDFKTLMDILSQRFLAVELRALGQPQVSDQLELVPRSRGGLAGPAVIQEATRALRSERVLQADQRGGHRR